MTSKRNRYGDGSITQRSPDVWRLRYWANGERVSQTYRGSKRDAQRELRRLIRTADTGEHVQPDKLTLGQWIGRWLASGCPGRRQREVGRRSLERYEQLLRCHVIPALGDRILQKLQPDEIDRFYIALKGKMKPKTMRHVHTVLCSCIAAAVRQRMLANNPIQYLGAVPSAGESDHGIALDPEQIAKLIAAFRGHPLYLLVVLALHSGCRRNELLALIWEDLNTAAKTLRIERSLERVKGISTPKGPKTSRGKRTITIDDEIIALLLAEKERHLRIAAGVPDGVTVDLSLIKLPAGALIFPGAPREGEGFSFTRFRNPNTVTNIFQKVARKAGFPTLRFHDLRGTAITRMLKAGIPLHIVAARHGHDPAVMLRSYAKALPQDDADAAKVMGEMLKGTL
jgi:integrase